MRIRLVIPFILFNSISNAQGHFYPYEPFCIAFGQIAFILTTILAYTYLNNKIKASDIDCLVNQRTSFSIRRRSNGLTLLSQIKILLLFILIFVALSLGVVYMYKFDKLSDKTLTYSIYAFVILFFIQLVLSWYTVKLYQKKKFKKNNYLKTIFLTMLTILIILISSTFYVDIVLGILGKNDLVFRIILQDLMR